MKTIYRLAAAASLLCASTMASAVDVGPLNPLVSPLLGTISAAASNFIVTYVPTGTAALAVLTTSPGGDLILSGGLPAATTLPALPGL